jgi:ketosteroid isomerase-like protein
MTVLQLEKDRFKAMINKDSSFLDRILANDLLYIHSNGVQDSKETFIRNIMNGSLEYIAVDLQQADIRTFSQTAWIHGAAKIKVRMGKDTTEVELVIRYLDVYKREDGEWKLVAWQSAKL